MRCRERGVDDQRVFTVSPVQPDRDAPFPPIHDEIGVPGDAVLRDLLVPHGKDVLFRILYELQPELRISVADVVLAVPVDAGHAVVRVFAPLVPFKDQPDEVVRGHMIL